MRLRTAESRVNFGEDDWWPPNWTSARKRSQSCLRKKKRKIWFFFYFGQKRYIVNSFLLSYESLSEKMCTSSFLFFLCFFYARHAILEWFKWSPKAQKDINLSKKDKKKSKICAMYYVRRIQMKCNGYNIPISAATIWGHFWVDDCKLRFFSMIIVFFNVLTPRVNLRLLRSYFIPLQNVL